MIGQYKKQIIYGAKVMVSGVLLVYLLQSIDFSGVLHSFQQMTLAILVLGIMLQMGSVLISALKWKMLLPDYSFPRLTQYSFIGQFYSLALPGQFAGEVVKGYRLAKGVDIQRIVSSVFIDKVTGVIGLSLVFVYGLIASTSAIHAVVVLIIIGLGASLVFFLMMRSALLYATIQNVIAAIGRLHVYLEKPSNILFAFLNECHLHSKKTYALIGSVALGVLFQFVAVAIIYVIAHGLGIETVSFADWCWIFGVVSLLVLLPVTIAGLGVREVSLVSMLSLFDVAPHSALALSFSILGLLLINAIIGGMLEFAALHRKE